MSFSLEVKNEICKTKEINGRDAFICGAILASGSLVIGEQGVSFVLSSENKVFLDYLQNQILENYPQAEFNSKNSNGSFKQKSRIEVSIDAVSGRRILTDLGILSFTKDGNLVIDRLGDSSLTIENEDKISYLKGLFLGGGSVSIPEPVDINDFSKSGKNSGYHMEWTVQTEEQARHISSLLVEFDILSRIVERNQAVVVYIKESEAISTILGLFGAHKGLLALENERAGREMRNLVNRQANCIAANIDKSINAALSQLKAIETIRETIGLESLPDTLLEVALARLANPEGSLAEIGEVLETKISKGAISQRFKKIMEIAKEIE